MNTLDDASPSPAGARLQRRLPQHLSEPTRIAGERVASYTADPTRIVHLIAEYELWYGSSATGRWWLSRVERWRKAVSRARDIAVLEVTAAPLTANRNMNSSMDAKTTPIATTAAQRRQLYDQAIHAENILSRVYTGISITGGLIATFGVRVAGKKAGWWTPLVQALTRRTYNSNSTSSNTTHPRLDPTIAAQAGRAVLASLVGVLPAIVATRAMAAVLCEPMPVRLRVEDGRLVQGFDRGGGHGDGGVAEDPMVVRAAARYYLDNWMLRNDAWLRSAVAAATSASAAAISGGEGTEAGFGDASSVEIEQHGETQARDVPRLGYMSQQQNESQLRPEHSPQLNGMPSVSDEFLDSLVGNDNVAGGVNKALFQQAQTVQPASPWRRTDRSHGAERRHFGAPVTWEEIRAGNAAANYERPLLTENERTDWGMVRAQAASREGDAGGSIDDEAAGSKYRTWSSIRARSAIQDRDAAIHEEPSSRDGRVGNQSRYQTRGTFEEKAWSQIFNDDPDTETAQQRFDALLDSERRNSSKDI